MTAKDILAFQFGREDAIRTVASSSSAIWTGLVLVLLTAFARNYDQTYIPEKPFLWFFGPLLFSFFSGSWLYMVCYTGCARRLMKADDAEPSSDTAWRGFMGAFWMTAPIAWLYAIPVERFFDSLTAAKANIALLGIVSLWRVVLMARVFQVVTRVPYVRTLLWVLLAAFGEMFVIALFGGLAGRSLLATMGGMRNSPEEEVVLRALNVAATVALWGAPAIFITLALWRWNGIASRWPKLTHARLPLWSLLFMAAAWTGISVVPQYELQRNFVVEQLVGAGEWRQAIDFMSRHKREHFAPARPLPPKLYERRSVRDGLLLAGEVRRTDEGWMQAHALRCLDTVCQHLSTYWPRETPLHQVDPKHFHFRMYGFEPELFLPILSSNRPTSYQTWLNAHRNLLVALRASAENPKNHVGEPVRDSQELERWRELAVALDQFGITNKNLPSDGRP